MTSHEALRNETPEQWAARWRAAKARMKEVFQMSDLVERLRNPNAFYAGEIARKAADEIETLRTSLKGASGVIIELREQLEKAKAAQRAAFIAGYERFPGPTGQWDRKKISQRAAEEWNLYVASLTDEKS